MLGFVNIFKPSGESSSKTVQFVKHILINELGCDKKIKVGHFGTLDPNACGVLPIAIGTACRLFDLTLDKIKVYKATIIFGKNSITLDDSGEIIEEVECNIEQSALEKVISEFPNEYAQFPPKISAKSVGGVRAYKLARSGIEFELQPKDVKVYKLTLVEKVDKNIYTIHIKCSAGTYIRSICRDIGERLGVPAIMGDLFREQSGDFTIETAVKKEDFKKNPIKYILPVDVVLKNKKKCTFNEYDLEKLKNGVRVKVDQVYDDTVVVDESGTIWGIGKTFDGEFGFTTRLR